MAKTKLYNPVTDKTETFDSEHAKKILAYQERVNSKTRFEVVKEKKKQSDEPTDD